MDMQDERSYQLVETFRSSQAGRTGSNDQNIHLTRSSQQRQVRHASGAMEV